MDIYLKNFGSFLVGVYVWVLTIFFGMVLLDILYSNLVPEAAAAFSEVSDFLLLIGFVTLLCAVAAIALTWQSSTARNLLIASLLVILMEFLTPVFFSPFIQNTQATTIGPWLRIIPGGLSSILALIGMYQYGRQK